MLEALQAFFSFVTGPFLLIVLLGTGIFLTLRLRFIQIRGLKEGIKITRGAYDDPLDPGDVSHFKALCAALSATVGVGNIAGVAAAIGLGGPGAIFWMWMTAFLGMAIKCTECTLAQMFRTTDKAGNIAGGPMYYIERGLGKNWKWLAVVFAFFTVLASFGIGNMVQSNQVAQVLQSSFGVSPYLSGLVIAVLTGLVIVGGVKRIGQVASFLVPFMAVLYIGAALFILFLNADKVFACLALIVSEAFAPTSIAGGAVGSAIMLSMRAGVTRGLFSNESGLGSAPIIHAAAKTTVPFREGLVALLEPFTDTIIICTMTALVILCTGTWQGGMSDAPLTAAAFEAGFSGGAYVVTFSIVLFAFSTAISWSYYGDRAAEYLLGEKVVLPFRLLYCVFLFVGAFASAKAHWITQVWNYADIANLLMAFPNLLALWMLSGLVVKARNEYFGK